MAETAAYSQMNGSVERYITETTYSPDVSETSILSYISSASDIPLDRPAGLALAADGDELIITDNSNGGTIRIPVKDGTAEIWNVAPTPAGGKYRLLRSGKPVADGTVYPTGQLRMIRTYGDAFNIRDIGGWTCAGGTVKYGKILRGSELDGTNFKVIFTEEDRQLFLDFLKVRCEIDLRSEAEVAGVTVPALSGGACIERYPIGPYVDMIDPSGPYARLFECLLRSIIRHTVAGETVYIHCMLGGDRTGALCAVLEGLLGVSLSNIEKDYELTSFSRVHEIRTRIVPPWKEFVGFINSFEGATFGDKVVSIVRKVGIRPDEIEAFRKAMIADRIL